MSVPSAGVGANWHSGVRGGKRIRVEQDVQVCTLVPSVPSRGRRDRPGPYCPFGIPIGLRISARREAGSLGERVTQDLESGNSFKMQACSGVVQEGHLLDKADEELSKFLSLPRRVFGSPLYDTVCTTDDPPNRPVCSAPWGGGAPRSNSAGSAALRFVQTDTNYLLLLGFSRLNNGSIIFMGPLKIKLYSPKHVHKLINSA